MSNVIAIMKEQGVTQTHLANELGISQAYLNDLLNGRRGSESLRNYAPQIAEILGAPVEELFPALAQDGEQGVQD
ncbi:MAG TPA: helix-turn-helix transcriptional regulator [Dehalococcoidia bacterium]|nr:helix-turn-helix transcriptional regulator [Dehalococcoidia bacterium]